MKFEAGGSMQWRCPKCDRETVNRQAQADHERRDREKREDEQRRRQAELEGRIGAAGIPARYREFNFDTFPGKGDRAAQHCSTLRSYANRWLSMKAKGISVLLVGTTGTGKTGLACSVANVVMREFGDTAIFMSAYGAVRHLRDTWGRKGRTEREALDDLINADLLVLDEIGASVGTDAEMTALFEVINGRYSERRPTILLSNLPIDDYHGPDGNQRPGLRSYLGLRIIDRFRDDGGFTLVFDWQSLRGVRS